ncbi:MAG: bifunctional molybdenum cofactor guanylyltransferase MobA/molybdopterin-guanine dinucleotide biosynthesis adaptor protein MobB [Bdellovibrio sp.]|nr:bifunctional molybdenum cofactor guanylyltransferase MobA/molybdopterin-guanine dinucleotide biosynthesis adaptor protein MobB [Bdellovibrio sp.]
MKKKKHAPRAYLYHPFEVVFSGLSGSGKTTLVEKLIAKFSGEYQVAYIKHDAHKFEMDHPGKDSHRGRSAGAHAVLISDPNHYAFTQNGSLNAFSLREEIANCHFALVEGHKTVSAPKIIVVDEQGEILKWIQEGTVTNVQAFIVSDKTKFRLPDDVPTFHRDDLEGIAQYVFNIILEKANKAPLYGLVLAGGMSSRMGQDKGALSYHGQTQGEYVYQLLAKYCSKTFVSCRPDQENADHLRALPQIHDRVMNLGPAGGILSAMLTYPEARWLVMACDLPLVDDQHVQHLIENSHPLALVSGHVDADGLPEPLSAIYRPEFKQKLFQFLGHGIQCPRKMLLNSLFHPLSNPDINKLMNANTPEDYSTILQKLEGQL